MTKIFNKNEIDQGFFASQLKVMLGSGLNLNRSLIILNKQSRSDSEKKVYNNLLEDIESGLTLSTALKKEQNFGRLFSAAVEGGEKSGSLIEVLKSLEKYFSSKKKLKKEIKKAFFYPITVIITVIIAAIFILNFVLPVFIELFNDFKGELPLITRLLIALSSFLNNYFYIIILFLIIVIIMTIIILKHQKFEFLKSNILLKIPLIKTLYQNLILTQIAVYLALFLKSGINLISSLNFLEKIIDDQQYKKFLRNTALNISKGSSLSECFSDSKYIPDLFFYLLMTGEESAEMETMLERAGDYYYQQLKDGIEKMLQYLEPLLITLTAIFVALLAAAVIMPMFQLYLII